MLEWTYRCLHDQIKMRTRKLRMSLEGQYVEAMQSGDYAAADRLSEALFRS